ncbi:hypothetical protein [Pseudomonas auratipiscis]|nr:MULTISPECIES: hypothetical protein [unclassified Pseudomonas]
MPQLAEKRYTPFNKQFIAGVWRDDNDSGVLNITDPFDGAALAQFVMANESDLDEACSAAVSHHAV